ncbi:hypothetical protein P7F60_12105 [Rhizobium sp. YJ-22]|uniref:hypothetical protein n=1 Tax=Rhizobium sp. YJ-22 TaxID=3037556 RepID=UPI0024127DCE|nr:hypothetical protein [Rhizobium sp. YJ-22]MDG3577136.1 hypothetical protein [Rhizobium sp. YJ-22]
MYSTDFTKNPQRDAEVELLIEETCFTKEVTTASGPALLIAGQVIELKAERAGLFVEVISRALRRGKTDSTVGYANLSPAAAKTVEGPVTFRTFGSLSVSPQPEASGSLRATMASVSPDTFMSMERKGSYDLQITVGGFKSEQEALDAYTALHPYLTGDKAC